MALIDSRKRRRPDEDEYTTQTKQFVNEITVNMNNETKMKEIQDKTIKMLFMNANPKSVNNNNASEVEMMPVHPVSTKWEEFGENICLMGDGHVNYIDASSKFATENVSRRCGFCARTSSIQATDCVNCNLEICEYCGISCIQCNAPLCMTCVQLFGCSDNSTDMNACCERCKQIYNFQ